MDKKVEKDIEAYITDADEEKAAPPREDIAHITTEAQLNALINKAEPWTEEDFRSVVASRYVNDRNKQFSEKGIVEKNMLWMEQEYRKRWCYDEKIEPKIKGIHGSIQRLKKIITFKRHCLYDTMDMIIIVLRIVDIGRKKEANYGSVFCELLQNITPLRSVMPHSTQQGIYHGVFINMYNSSPSFISCDGEYRSRLCRYESYIEARKKYPDVFSEIEGYVNSRKIRRRWNLVIQYFYPSLEQESKSIQVELALKTENIHFKLLAVSWFHTIYNEMLGMTEAHSNESYREIFLAYKEEDMEFMRSLIIKIGAVRIEEVRNALTQTLDKSSSTLYMLGYKMIPLNVKEVQDPLKLRYRPWREYFVSNKCNDLIVNSICPSFPFMNDWFYIKNSKKGLFDNLSQYERMKNSEIAKDVIHTLIEAQRGTYFAAENLPSIVKTTEDISKWINPKFRKLSTKIDEAIGYSMENIIMSEVTLGIISEFVGRTFSDTITILNSSNAVYSQLLGHPLTDAGHQYFAKYVFEICYALYCINTKLGILHGDFHLNNATIGALYVPHINPLLMPRRNAAKDATVGAHEDAAAPDGAPATALLGAVDDDVVTDDDEAVIDQQTRPTIDVLPDVISDTPKEREYVLYNISGAQYLYPNNGYFGCIIDFSRAIINPNKYEILTDLSLPSIYKLVSDEEKFRADEINTLVTLYVQLFPSKLRQREELAVLFKNHFDAVFKILSLLDIYMFTVRLTRILNKMTVPICKKAIALVEKIFKLSETYISQEMNSMIDNPAKHAAKVLADEWPILGIIKKCFSDFSTDTSKIQSLKGSVTDVYCYENHMTTSLNLYEKYPEFMKRIGFLQKDGGVTYFELVERINKEIRLEYEKQKTINLELVSYISGRHSAKFF